MDRNVEKYYNSSGIADYFSDDISEHLRLVEFSPGEFIFRQGDRTNKLLYILNGTVKYTYTLANGREIWYNRSKNHEIIGDLEFLGVWGETISVQAVEKCACFLIDTDAIGDQIRRDPAFLMSVIRKSATNSRQLSVERYSGARSGVSIETRLARHILERQEDGCFREKRADTADHLYITVRYLLLILADFCKKGYIERQGRTIKIIDREALELLADTE